MKIEKQKKTVIVFGNAFIFSSLRREKERNLMWYNITGRDAVAIVTDIHQRNGFFDSLPMQWAHLKLSHTEINRIWCEIVAFSLTLSHVLVLILYTKYWSFPFYIAATKEVNVIRNSMHIAHFEYIRVTPFYQHVKLENQAKQITSQKWI